MNTSDERRAASAYVHYLPRAQKLDTATAFGHLGDLGGSRTRNTGKVVQFQAVQPNQQLIAELEMLLAQARSGEIVGLAYAASQPGDDHTINLSGAYAAAPKSAFLPVCQLLLELGGALPSRG
jgi:hypothetical protein